MCGVDFDVRGEFCFVDLRSDCSANNRRAVFVSDVVLDYQYGADAALFRADYGAKVCVKYFASPYLHFLPPHFKYRQRKKFLYISFFRMKKQIFVVSKQYVLPRDSNFFSKRAAKKA